MAVRKLKDAGNDGNPNKVGDFNQVLGMGSAIRLGAMSIDGAVASHILTLPEGQKAGAVLFAYSRAGTLTGYLTGQPPGGAVATTQVGITPTGDILFATADAVTDAEVVYFPLEGAVVEKTVVVSGGVAPIGDNGARLLIEASQLTGGAAGAKTVVARGTAPSAGEAAVGVTGTVVFNAEANGEQVTVKYIEFPAATVVEKLEQTVAF